MLTPATLEDYPIIQNLARFYVYDLSRYCGKKSIDWAIPEDGLYESFDFKSFFARKDAFPYLIKLNQEIAGFVLIDKNPINSSFDWHVAEFFILARYQSQKLGEEIAHQLWSLHPGKWEVSVIPENIKALRFWEKAIAGFVCNAYEQKLVTVDFDSYQPNRIVFYFDSQAKSQKNKLDIHINLANLDDIDDMSRLSKAKRLAYEKVQPKFWSYAGEKGDEIQKAWFKELLDNPEYLLFIAKDSNQQCMGFVIGKLMQSPQVYNPGGLTLLIDDFCVATDALWPSGPSAPELAP